MACEERAASEAVRCRQLEGTLNEKEAVIEGLRHQLDQLDIQRKSAQEKEASTLREYLKSRAAQDEAERRLAMLESRSTLNATEQRHSKLTFNFYRIIPFSYYITPFLFRLL